MAGDTTFDTYSAEGIREDLIDVIYNIAPSDTPFVSNVGSGSSKGTYHEWQEDTLADPEDSRAAEGADAVQTALTPTTRLGNHTQINTKSFIISGSDLVADNAGRGVEMAYQEAKKGLELRKDVEARCVGQLDTAGDGTESGYLAGTGNSEVGDPVARRAANLLAWIGANADASRVNTDFGTNGVDPVVDASNPPGLNGRTDGDTRAFLESMLTNVIDKIYVNGGNPDVIMSNTKQKRVISQSFKGCADSRDVSVSGKRIINAVDFYESDYGVLSVVPNRYMRQTDVFVLDTEMFSVDNYRPYFTTDLAKTGDNEKKQMIVEWTLKSSEQTSSGGVFDLA